MNTVIVNSITNTTNVSGEIYGDYIPLKDMSDAVQKRLIELGYLFSSTNTGFFMPYGRGMFINDKRNFFVWVNQDEHLKIFTMQEGGDLGMCYRRLISGLQALSYQIKFARDSKFGFLNLCPSNIGKHIGQFALKTIIYINLRYRF